MGRKPDCRHGTKKKNYKIFINTNFPAFYPENRGADGLFTAKGWLPQKSGLADPVILELLNKIEFR